MTDPLKQPIPSDDALIFSINASPQPDLSSGDGSEEEDPVSRGQATANNLPMFRSRVPHPPFPRLRGGNAVPLDMVRLTPGAHLVDC